MRRKDGQEKSFRERSRLELKKKRKKRREKEGGRRE